MKYEVKELLKLEKLYGKIIVGLDFDDTIFPLRDDEFTLKRTKKVRKLIKELQKQDRIITCLWTVAEPWSLLYKKVITKKYGIKIDYYNESPLFPEAKSRKPAFNILLDDKAGLSETYKILKKFKNHEN